ncbi:MAG TPA: NAD(P)H-dependent oxidoreductase [Chryseolinea sp.]|nr:NAD(P)H-dependent oxidoreductase [Chryseolinea sp.]
MKVVVVFNHPYDGSYCNAILQSVIAGIRKGNHEVDVIHLDKDGFNPVMTAEDLKAYKCQNSIDPKVLEYKSRIDQADHLIFIFPIWWELMPALTKGFIDKVIFPGVAYEYGNKNHTRMNPLWIKIKGITMITTMNSPGILYWGVFGNAIQRAVMRGTFWKMGYKNRKWISLNMVKMVSEDKRKKWLTKLEEKFTTLK